MRESKLEELEEVKEYSELNSNHESMPVLKEVEMLPEVVESQSYDDSPEGYQSMVKTFD